MEMIIIDGTTYTLDFKIEEITEKSGKSVTEVKEIILNGYKVEAKAAVAQVADYYHSLISDASDKKLARYEEKAKWANSYLEVKTALENQDLSDGEKEALQEKFTQLIALLKPEANIRDLTIEQHVAAILTANAAFSSASSIIEAIQAQGNLAVAAAISKEELGLIQEKMPEQAYQAFTQWQESMGEV